MVSIRCLWKRNLRRNRRLLNSIVATCCSTTLFELVNRPPVSNNLLIMMLGPLQFSVLIRIAMVPQNLINLQKRNAEFAKYYFLFKIIYYLRFDASAEGIKPIKQNYNQFSWANWIETIFGFPENLKKSWYHQKSTNVVDNK